MKNSCCVMIVACVAAYVPQDAGAQESLTEQAAATLKKAVHFFRTSVSTHGAYVWQVSADLTKKEGEGRAGLWTAWVQPPGTPSVGLAYLHAYHATKDDYYLESAKETAGALLKGQLQSGGWDYRIEFAEKDRKKYAYRVLPSNPKGRNTTTLDDNNTQEALRFLMKLDETLEFKEKDIHEATTYALDSLLKAQYPNGAWPQRFSSPPDPGKYPVKKAGYPKTWSRTYPGKDYRSYYTLNDNTQADMIDVMFLAGSIYKDKRYTKAATKGGDFLVLAQMPDPQPAWAQQYDSNMYPAWARKFEPPAITGGESQGAMRTLMRVYRETGEKKYLAPIPKAVAFFRRVVLSDGRLARFYELKTSKPLYFTKTYQLTYNDDDLPTHYGFKVSNRIDSIAAAYEKLVKLKPSQLKPAAGKPRVTNSLKNRVRQIIDDLDKRGCWLEKGKLRTYPGGSSESIISSRTFIQNVSALATYLKAAREQE